MKTAIRQLLAAAMCGASLLLTWAVLRDAIRTEATSDAELLATFSASAYEDIFGFGFWPTWAAFLLIQLLAVGSGWLLIGKRRVRLVFPALLFAFTIASVLDYSSFERQNTLWQTRQR